MKKDKLVYARARDYLFTHGRELDRQRVLFLFEEGHSQPVIHALAKYQNDDGGFGRALEPDLRSNASSVIATTNGFEVMREVGIAANSDMARRAKEYLRRHYDPVRNVWPIIPPEIEDAPHAPWWTYADAETNFGGFRINPRAAVVGYILDHTSSVEYLDTRHILAEIIASLQAQPADMHDFQCVRTLLASPGLLAAERAMLEKAARAHVPELLLTNPDEWETYGMLPLDIAPSPDSRFSDLVSQELIELHLDRLIRGQELDGSWPIPWSWSFVSKEAWAKAEQEWKSYTVVGNLKRLLAYGRLDLTRQAGN